MAPAGMGQAPRGLMIPATQDWRRAQEELVAFQEARRQVGRVASECPSNLASRVNSFSPSTWA